MQAIPLILSVATTVVGAQGQARQAKATSKAAWDNYAVQQAQLKGEAENSNNQAMMEKSERAKVLMLEQAKIRTMSGEAGIQGNSVDALLNDSYMQAGIDLSVAENNRLIRARTTGYEQAGSYANARSTSNTAYRDVPSVLGTGLKIGSQVADVGEKRGWFK